MSENDSKGLTPQEASEATIAVASGRARFVYRGKEGYFRTPTLGEGVRILQIYNEEVTRLTRQGTLINDSMIPALLQKRVKEFGLDPRVIDERFRLEQLKRIYDALGEVGQEAVQEGKLTPEFVLNNAQNILGKFSDEDMEVFNAVNIASEFLTSLAGGTVEAQARTLRLKWEVICSFRNLDDSPFFPSLEALEGETEDEEMGRLLQAHQAFKSGRGADFLSVSPSPQNGGGTGRSQKRTRSKSSRKGKGH